MPFQINVDWSMEVVAPEGTSASWLSVEPASGAAGLHKVMVRVTENDIPEVRTATIHLLSGKSKVAEILVTQEESLVFEAVDLGLSVKWAGCNVGADSPEEYGDYFAWGETTTKSDYSSSTSITYGLSISELESRGIIGADSQLAPAYDAATVNWGDDWRMPTLGEIKELIDRCTWEWTSVNGVSGQKVTGPKGNSIFLPAVGFRLGTEVLRPWLVRRLLLWHAERGQQLLRVRPPLLQRRPLLGRRLRPQRRILRSPRHRIESVAYPTI